MRRGKDDNGKGVSEDEEKMRRGEKKRWEKREIVRAREGEGEGEGEGGGGGGGVGYLALDSSTSSGCGHSE